MVLLILINTSHKNILFTIQQQTPVLRKNIFNMEVDEICKLTRIKRTT